MQQSSLRRPKPPAGNIGSTVDAAALQSEMAKKYGIANSQRPKRRPRPVEEAEAKPRECSSCGSTQVNAEYCESCGYIPDNRQQEMEAQRQQESLAFRRGLLGSFKATSSSAKAFDPLKPLDWYLLEKSILKKVEPDACCPICMEKFQATEEVLLSCGHIFHKVCLRSFENFIRNADLSCPICRTKNYQKKVTNIGTMSHQKICCRTIQAAWRGYQARKEYRHLLRSHYKSGQSTINRDLQRKFYQQEVTTLATKLDDNMSSRAAQVDTLLTSMERTLDDSRQLDRLFEDMLRNRQLNRAELRLPPMHDADEASGVEPPPQRRDYLGGILTPRSLAFSLQPPSLPGEDSAVDAAPRIFSGTEFCIETSTPWSQVQKQALSRGQSDCAICMLPVSADISLLHDLPSRAKLQPNVKHSVLLSCSHVFHQHCIGNFERFTRNEGSLNCPVCRSRYSKRLL